MLAAASRNTKLNIPRIQLDADGGTRVVRWGEVSGLVLRPGDRLLPGSGGGQVLVLAPRGRGRPMLGQRSGKRLLALPSGVPASQDRWQVHAAVQVVERDLDRGGPRRGQWRVAVRIDALGPDARLDEARQALCGGLLDARSLGALCLRASLAPRRFGVTVAVVATQAPGLGDLLLEQVPAGCLHFELALEPASSRGQVITGPWAGSTASPRLDGPPRIQPVDRRSAGREASPQVRLPFVLDQQRRSRT